MKKLSSNKSFGLVMGIFFLILCTYFYFKKEYFNVYLVITSSLFFILGFFNSNLLTPLNKAWIKVGDLLGTFISPIILIMVYFAIIFPTKIILVIFNKDILDLDLNIDSKTYWKKNKNFITSMNKQF